MAADQQFHSIRTNPSRHSDALPKPPDAAPYLHRKVQGGLQVDRVTDRGHGQGERMGEHTSVVVPVVEVEVLVHGQQLSDAGGIAFACQIAQPILCLISINLLMRHSMLEKQYCARTLTSWFRRRSTTIDTQLTRDWSASSIVNAWLLLLVHDSAVSHIVGLLG